MPTAGAPPVALQIAVGSGAGSTLTPAAAIYLTSSVVTLGTHAEPSRPAIGATDGTTQRAVGNFSENTSASSADAGGQQDTATVLQVNGPANVNREAEVRWSAWTSGGSDLLVDDLPANAYQALGLHFFGGSWKLVEFAGDAVEDATEAVTGLGFTPNIALVFSPYDAFSADGSFTDMRHALGMAVKTPAGAIQQVAFTKYVNSRNGLQTGNAAALRDDCLLATFTQAADSALLELTSWDADGATFTTRDASVSRSAAILFGYIPNVRLWCGVLPTSDPGSGLPWLNTASATAQTVTVGIKPAAYCLIGTQLATKNTRDTSAAVNGWSYGWWTGHEQFVHGGHEPDANGSPESISHLRDDQIAHVTSLHSLGVETTDWAASHSSAGDTGPVISIDAASAAGRLTALLVIGEAHSVSTETVQISDAVLASTTLVASEDVAISDTMSATAILAQVAEDVRIADDFALAGTTVQATEQVVISDAFLAIDLMVASEDVAISDDHVFVQAGTNSIVLDIVEDVEISEEILARTYLEATETVEIQDDVRFRGTGVAVDATESIQIGEQMNAYLGDVLVTSESIAISDGFSFGAGAVAEIVGPGKGKTVQAGAERGTTAQAGVAKGGRK